MVKNIVKAIAWSNFRQNKSQSPSVTEIVGLFLGGAGAGLVVFMLFGGIWQVQHFWWVMSASTIFCGLLAVMYRQNFEKILDALLDHAPWL